MDLESLLEKAEEERASSHFAHAARIYRKLSRHPHMDPIDRAQALLGLADMERIQGDFQDALKHYSQGAKVLKKNNPALHWDAQVGWALAARACGRPKEALVILQKALLFYKKQKDPSGEAFTHWALGGTYRIAGDMKRGLQELLIAFHAYRKYREPEGTAYTCCALGGIYRMLGRYSDSGRFYREANRRMRQRDDTFGIAYSYCGLGNVERMGGRFTKALPFYKKAEKLYGTIGDRVSYAYTLWSLGTTYKMLGLYTQAVQAFYKADHLFQKTGDTRGRIYSLLGFAEIEYLKAQDSHSPRPLRERARVRGGVWWKKAKTVSDHSHFFWENLHVTALKNGRVQTLRSQYQKAGSRFFPDSLPVNWP